MSRTVRRVLGIFLVSVIAQFVTATDLAMVAVSIPPRGSCRAVAAE